MSKAAFQDDVFAAMISRSPCARMKVVLNVTMVKPRRRDIVHVGQRPRQRGERASSLLRAPHDVADRRLHVRMVAVADMAERRGEIVRSDENPVDAVERDDLVELIHRAGAFDHQHDRRARVGAGQVLCGLTMA